MFKPYTGLNLTGEQRLIKMRQTQVGRRKPLSMQEKMSFAKNFGKNIDPLKF
jgi:hypothetical protein